MKRLMVLILISFCLFISACDNNEVVKTDAKGGFGEQYDKKPLRMVNINGTLYYDSGRVSEQVRCGVMDGALKSGAKANEIPLNHGEANFISNGYQNKSNGTIEANADGKWVIFEKCDNSEKIIRDTKYCYYIRGCLNNAAADSEIIVFSEKDNVTFDDVYGPLLSSKYPSDYNKGKLHYIFLTPDKWGINLQCKNVSPSGMTLLIEQSGGSPSGKLETGYEYSIQRFNNVEWTDVKGEPMAWVLLALDIKMNDVKEMKINWENVYGNLEPGFYRIKKEIMDFRYAGDYDKKIYEAYFEIE